ncbi:MAG: helix-turn-helix domain-containing protein [Thermoguttaceae bacterium]|jgi:AcrR family transcriptional regulator
MKKSAKMPSADRRTAIISAAQRIFVEKGFDRTTTRSLAEAAGVSEALLFRHFPSKEALYSAIQMSCFKEEDAKFAERLQSLEPSTTALVFWVSDLVSHILARSRGDEGLLFFRLVLRSLMDEGEFSRLAIQGGPSRWVKKVEECIEAANRAGDMLDRPVRANLAGWMVHQLITGIMLHNLPHEAVIDYGVSHEELVKQVVWFCLRGMGLKEEAIRRCCESEERP